MEKTELSILVREDYLAVDSQRQTNLAIYLMSAPSSSDAAIPAQPAP